MTPQFTPLQFDEYQRKAHRTANYPEEVDLAYTGLGLSGEAGEAAEVILLAMMLMIKSSKTNNQIKKVYRDDDGKCSVDRRYKILDELGDCLWYIAEACTKLGYSLESLAHDNLRKLEAREKNGTIHGDKREDDERN